MRTMQAKITELIRGAVEDVSHLDLDLDQATANTGTLYAMSGLTTVMTIRYNFQHGYCSMHLAGPAIDRAVLPPRHGQGTAAVRDQLQGARPAPDGGLPSPGLRRG
jgi:hypothetical protein